MHSLPGWNCRSSRVVVGQGKDNRHLGWATAGWQGMRMIPIDRSSCNNSISLPHLLIRTVAEIARGRGIILVKRKPFSTSRGFPRFHVHSLRRSSPILSSASSITTELPRMTTMPILSRSPPGFSSTASSRTMFRKTYPGTQILASTRFIRAKFSFISMKEILEKWGKWL